VIDAIIPEPVGGAHRDAAQVFRRTGDIVARAFNEFARMDADAIRHQRHEKFLAIGRNL
jgi:acetyl-CoA carboxylase carboxyl transferase subunit alpha